jgi:23S rRNA pseudouridine1911/1915/1917 synthase
MKKIIIIKEKTNRRFDKFLKEEVFFNENITRGEIIRQIKKGNILVNSKKNKPSYILKENDKIEINFDKKSEKLIPNKDVKIDVIYQDENIVAINKPVGISVHPVKLDEDNTLVNGLICQFPEIKKVGDDPEIRPGIVHRLDKDTSGIMVVARNQKTFEELKKKFKNREVEKKYLAIVHGKPENKTGVIEKPLARSSDYKKQIVANKKTKTIIRPATTKYRVTQEFSDYSLVEVSPKTGRMHQIRVHMKSIGHPIAGDQKYSLKGAKEDNFAKRQMLHAKSIKFSLFGKNYDFSAEFPKDFQDALNFLTKSG